MLEKVNLADPLLHNFVGGRAIQNLKISKKNRLINIYYTYTYIHILDK